MATLAQGMAKLDKVFHRDPVPQINSLLYADNLIIWSTGSDIPKLESTLSLALVTLTNWSLEKDFKCLTSTFTSFIRPVIDYGCELLVTASGSALSKLDIVQNKALRFITGAATLAPIATGPSERRQYSTFALADPVPNIRLRLCAVLPRLKGLIKLPKDSHLLQQLESCIKALISDEKDRDVSYAVSREFNSKLLEESKNLHALSLSPNVAKSGKIPIRKKKVSSSQSKSLRILKKERRISSPAVIVEFQKNSSQILQTRDVSTSTTDTVKTTSSPKCNIPKSSRSQSPNVRTWPRQKRSSSLIPKQSVNRCPSPMPQQRRFSEQINKEISSPEIVKKTLSSQINKEISSPEIVKKTLSSQINKEISSPEIVKKAFNSEKKILPPSNKVLQTAKENVTKKFGSKDISSSIPLDSKRRTIGTILPSPEVIRRSTTLNNLSSDSKIPSFSKKSVAKES
ncbi:hypothetical protein TNIN_446931 [Trichonephila inaurata madagascariensis]|uniref:Uncharacterized protein n=1 Tax=Trichonephila inaurata madagascariensis TaxID=2747483 RepID=A0A8X6XH16_9ARAC|nr:hypothetical protein TNIN_446931 [Trichonephila inaurata madagascariensis]